MLKPEPDPLESSPQKKNRCPAHDATVGGLGGDVHPRSSSSCNVTRLMSQCPLRDSLGLLGQCSDEITPSYQFYELQSNREL